MKTKAKAKAVTIVTVSWKDTGEEYEDLHFKVGEEQLRERDPDAKSLISAKMHFDENTSHVDFSPMGPGNDEVMSPTLINFIFNFIETGSLDVPVELDPVEAERALDFFGFSVSVSVPASDPKRFLKVVSLKECHEAKEALPRLFNWLKNALEKSMSSAGAAFVVVDHHGGDAIHGRDWPMEDYKANAPAGTFVQRFGGVVMTSQAVKFLGASSDTACQMRRDIARMVEDMGLKATWRSEYLILDDHGE